MRHSISLATLLSSVMYEWYIYIIPSVSLSFFGMTTGFILHHDAFSHLFQFPSWFLFTSLQIFYLMILFHISSNFLPHYSFSHFFQFPSHTILCPFSHHSPPLLVYPSSAIMPLCPACVWTPCKQRKRSPTTWVCTLVITLRGPRR